MPREFPDLGQRARTIDAEELKSRLDDGEAFTLLDTRRADDFDIWQISHPNLHVVNVPFMAFLDESGENPAGSVPEGIPDGTLVTCCAKGISSEYVADFLAREGFDVLALDDGMEGWANLYEEHPVETTEGIVVQLHRPSSGCLSYLYVSGDQAAVIDPLRAFVSRYPSIAAQYDASIEYAIDTHVHADHVSGVRELAAETGGTVVLPGGATERGLEFDAHLISDGETLPLGDREITAHALPGHTTEMIGYLFAGVFATGDTIFLDGVARPDLEDEDAAQEAAGTLWQTVQHLETFDSETIVAPAHIGPTTAPGDDGSFTATLGQLQNSLTAFQESKSAFVDRVTSDLPPQPTNYREIIAVNLGQQSATAEESFELELGPNNCAVGE